MTLCVFVVFLVKETKLAFLAPHDVVWDLFNGPPLQHSSIGVQRSTLEKVSSIKTYEIPSAAGKRNTMEINRASSVK
jgi:hypothetical protein